MAVAIEIQCCSKGGGVALCRPQGRLQIYWNCVINFHPVAAQLQMAFVFLIAKSSIYFVLH